MARDSKNSGQPKGAMALTRRGRRPLAGFYREPAAIAEWTPSLDDWRRIEWVYGHVLNDELRGEIAELVNNYFYFDQLERNTPFAADAIEYLATFEKAASSFVGMLTNDLKDATASSTRDILRDYCWFDPEDPEADNFAKLAETVNSLIAAAHLFASDLKSEKAAGRKGRQSAWDRMIVDLTAAVAPFRLPMTVNKGTDKTVSEAPSAFVRFVMELQGGFPAERRRHHVGVDGEPSYAATASAVSDAQSAHRTYRESRDVKSPPE